MSFERMDRSVGEAVAAARAAAGLTPSEAADCARLSRLTYRLLEQSAYAPSRDEVTRLVRVLSLPASCAKVLIECAERRALEEAPGPASCRVVTSRGTVNVWAYFVLVDDVGPAWFVEPAGRRAR